jgi:hypothetical protein
MLVLKGMFDKHLRVLSPLPPPPCSPHTSREGEPASQARSLWGFSQHAVTVQSENALH